MLVEPAASLTDLALGLVALVLALRLRAAPGVHPHWTRSFAWASAAALAGAVHHGVVVRSDTWSGPSWAVISGIVVVAISYLLAASVVEVLGEGRSRVFWVLRSGSLIAYAAVAASGRAGIAAILLCEGVTMLAVLALWVMALRRRHPLAWPVAAALVASMGAAAARALPAASEPVPGLDPTSLYHVAQIPGLLLLAWAVAAARPRRGPLRPIPLEDLPA
ncbi:MAG: hypothetical protein AB1416_08820 [Actinomycetota bacterium]